MPMALILALFLLLAPVAPAGAASPLADAAWLARNLSRVVVIDVRPAARYARGHIPGALSLPFSIDAGPWTHARYGVKGFLAPIDDLAAALGAAGISRDSPLVVVAGSGPAALAAGARVFWSLRVLGHQDLRLLDGGMSAWRAIGGALSTRPARRPAQHYLPRPDFSILATLDQTRDALDNNVPPIDARDMDRFYGYRNDLGEEDGGTILDAVNVPAETLLDAASGRYLPAPALRRAFLSRGAVLDQRQVVTFSTWGVSAALAWFALHEILHVPDTRLYDGSLAEWAAEGMDLYDSTDGMGGVIGG